MSKVKKITVSNLKAVSKLTADFNGCTAIITGGNNKGKTSFLRGLFDRIRGTKPDSVLKQGETEGFAECELTTGEKLKWEFNDNGKGFKEKLTFITEKDIKTPLTVALRNKFLPETFDVDKFLQDQPAKQRKTLQQLVGLDFTDVDNRYKSAYDDREAANRTANEQSTVFRNMAPAEKIEPVDMQQLLFEKDAIRNKLNKTYLDNKAKNDEARKLWLVQCDDMRDNVEQFNATQKDRNRRATEGSELLSKLKLLGYNGNEVLNFIQIILASIEDEKIYTAPPEPTYIPEMPDNAELLQAEEKINTANEANRKAQVYHDWLKQKDNVAAKSQFAGDADILVKTIETERMNMIKSAKMPEGFGFSEDGITYNGLSFTREQLSSSGIYIAALKLAAMTLGDVRTLHFDASFLDKISLADIEAWAITEDLQLLIERPDFEGGEIEYQLLNVTGS